VTNAKRAFGGRRYVVSTHMGDVEEWRPGPVTVWATGFLLLDVSRFARACVFEGPSLYSWFHLTHSG
jgi:hypothetical protein